MWELFPLGLPLTFAIHLRGGIWTEGASPPPPSWLPTAGSGAGGPGAPASQAGGESAFLPRQYGQAGLGVGGERAGGTGASSLPSSVAEPDHGLPQDQQNLPP